MLYNYRMPAIYLFVRFTVVDHFMCCIDVTKNYNMPTKINKQKWKNELQGTTERRWGTGYEIFSGKGRKRLSATVVDTRRVKGKREAGDITQKKNRKGAVWGQVDELECSQYSSFVLSFKKFGLEVHHPLGICSYLS